MNELVPEAGIGLGIENALQPIDDDLVPVRVSEFSMIGQPKVCMMTEAIHVDGDQWRAQGDRRGWQEAYARASLDRIKDSDA